MNLDPIIERFQSSSNIVFFGGAGTSTESAIPDFRSDTGLFSYAPEEILRHSFFMRNTEQFYEFYKSKMIYKDARPNQAHQALAELEKRGRLKAVITQNIDGLHQLAGSNKVLELHGSIHRNYCMDCRRFYSLDDMLQIDKAVPRCVDCGGIIKPDVVLYEESLNMDVLESAINYISEAEILIVGGTSLTVQPAAGLIRYYNGDCLILINKKSTPYDRIAKYVIHDSIGKVMHQLVSSGN